MCADPLLALPQSGNFNRPGNHSSDERIDQSAESFPSFFLPARQSQLSAQYYCLKLYLYWYNIILPARDDTSGGDMTKDHEPKQRRETQRKEKS